MTKLRAGIIGCGRPGRTEGATGSGTAHVHAKGYVASPDCELVAAADIKPQNLEAFCDQYGIEGRYLDHREMLAQAELDLVSVCVWPHLHAPMVIDTAQAGVRAIHCEKPMALTWGDAKRMVAICQEQGVQLTFNHQRRFGNQFRQAKALADGGAIGDLVRLESFTSNLYDWGTHWFDMMFFYNGDVPAEWVIGQIDGRGGRAIFGAQVEGQGLSWIRYRNGVYGLMVTGQAFMDPDLETREERCANRLIGSTGTIEVGVSGGPQLRFRNLETGGAWKTVDVGEPETWADVVGKAIQGNIDALLAGVEPELAARKALQATELIFATWESSRRRGRVDLPLEIEDSPLLSMIESGQITIAE
jgi:predicted dehydrogenase